jgi:hypothetical protein
MNYDIVQGITEYLEQETQQRRTAAGAWKAILALSCTNQTCNMAASKALYRTITVSPVFTGRHVLDLQRKNEALVRISADITLLDLQLPPIAKPVNICEVGAQ